MFPQTALFSVLFWPLFCHGAIFEKNMEIPITNVKKVKFPFLFFYQIVNAKESYIGYETKVKQTLKSIAFENVKQTLNSMAF